MRRSHHRDHMRELQAAGNNHHSRRTERAADSRSLHSRVEHSHRSRHKQAVSSHIHRSHHSRHSLHKLAVGSHIHHSHRMIVGMLGFFVSGEGDIGQAHCIVASRLNHHC